MKIVLLSIICMNFVYAKSFDQKVTGEGESVESNLESKMDLSNEAGHLPGLERDQYLNSIEESASDHFLSNENSEELESRKLNKLEKIRGQGTLPPTSQDTREELLVNKNSEIFDTIKKYNNKILSINLLKDDYEYKNSSDSFQEIYRTKESYGDRVGLQLLFQYSSFFTQGSVMRWFWGGGSGVGHNSGKSFFKNDKSPSDTKFQLWSIPLDLVLGSQIQISRRTSIFASAGASGILLWQIRNDLSDSNPKRSIRQFGQGYVASAGMRFDITSGKNSLNYFNSYNVTSTNVELGLRYQNYSTFKQSDVSIEGISFGLGINFNYY